MKPTVARRSGTQLGERTTLRLRQHLRLAVKGSMVLLNVESGLLERFVLALDLV